MATLLRSFAPEFDEFVLTHGFSITESIVKPEEFGDVSIVLHSSAFNLQLYTDRGQRFVDIGQSDGDWHKLEYVLEFLDPACTQAWFGSPPAVDKLVLILKRNLQAVTDLLSSDLDVSGFTSFEKNKSASLISSIFGYSP